MRTLLMAMLSTAVTWASVIMASEPGGSPEYYRTDCIVKFSIDWQDDENVSSNEVNKKLMDVMTSEGSIFDEFPIAGMNYPTRRTNSYFVQYFERCDARLKITEQLIELAARVIHPIADYVVFPDRIDPSSSTIDLSGPEWRD